MGDFSVRLGLLCVVAVFLVKADVDAQAANHYRPKRYLDWLNNMIMSSDEENHPSLEITSYVPHPSTDPVDQSQNYVGFALYEGSVGTFHFVLGSKAEENARFCERPSVHAGAYRYIYQKCPGEDTNLVASGFCYNSTLQGLVYNSKTFNQASGRSYLNAAYYEGSSTSEVHPNEQQLLTYCYNLWEEDGFPVPDFTCPITVPSPTTTPTPTPTTTNNPTPTTTNNPTPTTTNNPTPTTTNNPTPTTTNNPTPTTTNNPTPTTTNNPTPTTTNNPTPTTTNNPNPSLRIVFAAVGDCSCYHPDTCDEVVGGGGAGLWMSPILMLPAMALSHILTRY